MSKELRAAGATGFTVYAHIFNLSSQRWNGSAFEDYSSGNYANYDTSVTEDGSSGVYHGDFPTGITTESDYEIVFYRQTGGSPAEGDPIFGTQFIHWSGTAVVATPDTLESTSREIRGVGGPGLTHYAHVLNLGASRWNGSSFEAYSSGNYANYDLSLTEDGDSGVYLGSLPVGFAAGLYEILIYRQLGASPAEGDPVVSVQEKDYIGSALSGAMTGPEFLAYVKRTFKRTDKDTELYESITDIIQDMLRRFKWSEAQREVTISDTIGTLGEFKLNLESDFGMLCGIVIEDGTDADPLVGIPKWKFDQLYPDINVTTDRSYPRHFTIWQNIIRIGPVPDDTSYVYRKSYTISGTTINADSVSVPFTDRYRDILKFGTLGSAWEMLRMFEMAQYWESKYERKLGEAMHRETFNSGDHLFAVHPQEL